MSLENRLSRRNFLKTIGAGSLAAASLGAEPAKASISDLEFRVSTIPRKEGIAGIPVKINDDGTVIGFYLDLAGGNKSLFLYKEGRVRHLDFEVPDEFDPTGINGFPDFVFGQIDGDSLLYRLGKKEPIRLNFFASDINDRYVVGHSQGLSYRYDLETGEKTRLGNFEAVAVDKQGRVTGNNGSTAVVWENEQIRELERYREGTTSYPTYARDISNGIVIGDIIYSSDEYAACMWDLDGNVTKLPFMNAAAINNGMMLGSSELYQDGETVVDLSEVVNGIIGADINNGIIGADINKKGQIIGTSGEGNEIEGIILNIGNKSYIPPDTASLKATLTVTNQYVQDGITYYDYDLVIEESNGVGVNINKGRPCFENECGDWTTISPPRRVPPNGQHTRSSYWWTGLTSDAHWLEYEGKDDNGNSVSVVSNKLIHPS